MGRKPVKNQPMLPGIAKQVLYCLDATALIDLHNAKLSKKLTIWVSEGCIRVPEGVYRELRRKSDKLKKLLDKWQAQYIAIVQLNDVDKNQLSYMEKTYGPEFSIGDIIYPGFWKSASGHKAADGQVVALAKTRKWVVVSGDRSVRGACAKENIECISWEDFARRLSLIKLL